MDSTAATPVLRTEAPAASRPLPQRGPDVAVIVEWRGRIALLRRSAHSDVFAGRWDCITGHLEAGSSAEQQVLVAIFEATGIKARAIDSLDDLGILDLLDDRSGVGQMHIFRVTTRQRRLALGQCHDANRWAQAAAVPRFGNRTPWLDDVLAHAASSPGLNGDDE